MKITDLFAPFPDELQIAATPRVPAPPRVEWASAWGDLFFRVKGADPQILWCVLGIGGRAKEQLSQAFVERNFFRVVPFDDGDDWLLVNPKRALVQTPIQENGAFWKWKTDFIGESETSWLTFSALLQTWVPSSLEEKEFAWLSQPSQWFDNWLAQNTNEDLQLARAFAHLNADQRTWWPLTHDAQTRARWEQLIPPLQKLSYALAQTNILVWKLLSQNRSSIEVSTQSYRPYANDYLQTPAIRDLLDLLFKNHPMRYQPNLWRELSRRGQIRDHQSPTFTITAPTQHERLEAALLWRDFGREIGQSERVETALSQLLSG